ncbi:MAG: SpoIVB peptidase S55 domain-containing protein [Armatimonadota bacterium]
MTIRAAQLLGAAAFAILALLAGGRAWCGSPAPLIPRSQMLTVDELRPGMKGVGKSVFQGTKVENFGVTVVGVLRRVDFDGDIILIRIDSGPPVSKGFGVVMGMSGSPIYVNGKLIGALAYAWTFAKTPIAGVTPIAQMLEAFQPGSCPAPRSGTLRAALPFTLEGRRVERAVVIPAPSAAAVTGGDAIALVPIATPVLVSGASPHLIEALGKALEPLGLRPMAGAGSAGRVNTTMVPGQAVGARLVSGDLDLTAVGTVTYVKGDSVLAFGHSMAGLGATDVPLVAAYVHGVLPAADISFKLASGGQALGRFTEDRPWCIGGKLDQRSDLIEASLRITDRDRAVARGYRVQVIRNRSLTSTLLVFVLGGAIESVGPPAEGTTRARFVVEAKGLPRLERENTYTVEAQGGILALLLGALGGGESAEGELSQILSVLQDSEFGEARLGRVAVEVELSKVRRFARVEDAYISTPEVRAGDEVKVGLVIRTSDGGLVHREETIRVPDDCPPGRVRVGVAGGRSAEGARARLSISEPRPASLAQMVQQMLGRPANDELVIDLALPTVGVEARGHRFRDLPPAAIDLIRSATANRPRVLRDYAEHRVKTEWVVSGSVVLNLTVEGEEKDKGGRPPSPQYEPPRYDQISGGFADLLFGGEGESTDTMVDLEGGARALSGGRRSAAAGDDVDLESPPPMPSWDEVEAVGETELPFPPPSESGASGGGARTEAVGRVASTWRLTDPRELVQGESRGVALMSTGALGLAPRAEQLSQVDARCLWPLAVSADGAVYTGSWGDGRLRRTTPDGATATVLETDAAAVQAVAADFQGTVYAAAVPGGVIYRITPGGAAEKLCELGVQNVWALGAAPDGAIWAATGGEGRLFRISPDGQFSIAFTAPDRHITALALGPDGVVYLGTSPRGKVYAVGPDGAARAICEVSNATVQSMAVAAGNVYLGTSPDARVLKVTSGGATEEMLRLKGKHVTALLARSEGSLLAAAGPDAKLVEIHPDKRSALLYDAKSAYIAALATDPAGSIYLTVADGGRVLKLNCRGQRSGSYTAPVRDGGAVTRWGAVRWRAVVPQGAEVSVSTRSGATSRPDATWSGWQPVPLLPGAAVVSPPARFLQCRIELRAEAAAPEVESLEISYLPANRAPEVKLSSPTGGEVWSGKQTVRWSGRDPDGDKLDYRVYWSSDGGGTWTRIEAPQKEGRAAGEGGGSGARSVAAEKKPEASGKSNSTAESEDDSGRTEEAPDEPSGTHSVLRSRRPVRHSGSAVPVQDDTAGPDIESELVRALEEELASSGEEEMPEEPGGEGEERPRPAISARRTSLRWDTSKVSDAVCRLKVVASDSAANPADPQTAEAVSNSFVIDNTPPEIIAERTRKNGDPPPASVSVFDGATYITSAEFRVDSGEWLAALPLDGLFDSSYEGVALDQARLPEGAHRLEIRARDAAANTATTSIHYKR